MHPSMADHSVATDVASAVPQAAVASLCDINSSMSQATQADFLQLRCALNGKNEAQLASIGECPLDPGGYFIVRVGLCVWPAHPCIKHRLQHNSSMQHSPHMHPSCTGLTVSVARSATCIVTVRYPRAYCSLQRAWQYTVQHALTP